MFTSHYKLTGKYQHKVYKRIFRKDLIVLMVEATVTVVDYGCRPEDYMEYDKVYWKMASQEDLYELQHPIHLKEINN